MTAAFKLDTDQLAVELEALFAAALDALYRIRMLDEDPDQADVDVDEGDAPFGEIDSHIAVYRFATGLLSDDYGFVTSDTHVACAYLIADTERDIDGFQLAVYPSSSNVTGYTLKTASETLFGKDFIGGDTPEAWVACAERIVKVWNRLAAGETDR